MPYFDIVVKETWIQRFEVEADSQDHALELYEARSDKLVDDGAEMEDSDLLSITEG